MTDQTPQSPHQRSSDEHGFDMLPRSIHAGLHKNALKRVTRSYSASLADIFAETLQNARRAGATAIRVDVDYVDPDAEKRIFKVSITDDGEGIRDPSVLLSFGANGWSNELVDREDAAGMGLLSLASRGCTVTSRPRFDNTDDPTSPNAFRVFLRPKHFLGESPATVQSYYDSSAPLGTTVSFHTAPQENLYSIDSCLGLATRYFPIPVTYTKHCEIKPESHVLSRALFLEGACHRETWRGIEFGVFCQPGSSSHDQDLNFYGHTLRLKLPHVQPIHTPRCGPVWSVRADVQNCPDLELVLPARKEAVQNAFLAELHDAAKLAIYRAMAEDKNPLPRFEDWKAAKDAGIDVTPPPRALQPWTPKHADPDHYEVEPDAQPVDPETAIVCCLGLGPQEDHALSRALKRNNFASRIYEADSSLRGYDWYDNLPKLVGIDISYETHEGSFCVEDYKRPDYVSDFLRPDAITILISTKAPNKPMVDYWLSTDFAFASEEYAYLNNVTPLVTKDSDIEACDLADLITASYFSPSDDCTADSYQTQSECFDTQAKHMAFQLLHTEEEARIESIRDIVSREVLYLLPGKINAADIKIRNNLVSVKLVEPEESKAA